MLADRIAGVLGQGGATAAEVAEQLGERETVVVFTLFSGHGRFRCDGRSPSRWWLASAPEGRRSARRLPPRALPRPESLGLYGWQVEALRAWRLRGGRGVVEAVTGTGKTMLGVAAALDELQRRGQVVVLVPTLELQTQWMRELRSRLPDSWRIGRLGGGSADTTASSDILVAVVNSARDVDLRPIRPGGLLVADECHRYGSAANRLALDQRYPRRLGLSATYARQDDGNLAWLDPYFGGTCFRLDYGRAVADGVTAHFTVSLIGVRLPPWERVRYEELTEKMVKLRAVMLRTFGLPAQPLAAFLGALTDLARGDGEGARLARVYRQAMLERRRLLADTTAKDEALGRLAPAVVGADRAIIFTQSIAVAERSAATLAARGLRVVVVHSWLPQRQRREVLDRFTGGEIDAVAAPRVLDEGINVPAADLAVIVGASHSRRQMIQRMGRVLRRKPDGRRARFAILFVEATVEDPELGAHETFLEEVVEVADQVTCFPAALAERQPGTVLDAL